MHRVGIALMLVTSSLYGVHNLQLNGVTYLVIPIGTPVLMYWETEAPGATTVVKVYFDYNHNEVLDATDPLITWATIEEGSAADLDEDANSIFTQSQTNYVIGNFIIYAEDNGVSDTAYLEATPFEPPTGYMIWGYVEPPHKGILVVGVSPSSITKGEGLVLPLQVGKQLSAELNAWGAFTDDEGRFEVHFPEQIDSVLPIAFDVCNLTGMVSQQSLLNFVTVDGVIPVDTIYFVPPTDSACGIVNDDMDSPLGPDLLVLGITASIFDPSVPIYIGVTHNHADGTFSIPIVTFWISAAYVFAVSTHPYVPYHMIPPYIDTIASNPHFTELEFISYIADTTISGHVYMNGQSADNIVVYATRDEGTNIGISLSSGYYEVRVASRFPEYELSVVVPDTLQCEMAETTQVAAPGDTGIDFHLVCVGVETSHTYPLFDINPIVVTGECKVEFQLAMPSPVSIIVYDITGRWIKEVNYPMLAAGRYQLDIRFPDTKSSVYFIRFVTRSSCVTRKLILLQ